MDKPLIFTFSPDFVSASEARKLILDEAIHLGFNTQNQFAIKLVLDEALITAIRHDPKNVIKVEAKSSENQFEIILEAGNWRKAILFDLP